MNHRPNASAAKPYRHLGSGWCCICGAATLNKDGTPSRRTWHTGRHDGEPNCLNDYWFDSGVTSAIRRKVEDRDAKICAACPAGTPPCDTPENPVPWDADHIVPLIDGGEHSMDNLQTLCRDHHKRKTAIEARVRAGDRRQAAAQDRGQGMLWTGTLT